MGRIDKQYKLERRILVDHVIGIMANFSLKLKQELDFASAFQKATIEPLQLNAEAVPKFSIPDTSGWHDRNRFWFGLGGATGAIVFSGLGILSQRTEPNKVIFVGLSALSFAVPVLADLCFGTTEQEIQRMRAEIEKQVVLYHETATNYALQSWANAVQLPVIELDEVVQSIGSSIKCLEHICQELNDIPRKPGKSDLADIVSKLLRIGGELEYEFDRYRKDIGGLRSALNHVSTYLDGYPINGSNADGEKYRKQLQDFVESLTRESSRKDITATFESVSTSSVLLQDILQTATTWDLQ